MPKTFSKAQSLQVKSHTLLSDIWTHSGKPEDPSVDSLPPHGFPQETVNLEENITLVDAAMSPQ